MKPVKRMYGFSIGQKLTAINPHEDHHDYEECEVVGWWSDGMRGSSNFDAGPRCYFPKSGTTHDVANWTIRYNQ